MNKFLFFIAFLISSLVYAESINYSNSNNTIYEDCPGGQVHAGSIDGAQSVCTGEIPNPLGSVNYRPSLFQGLLQQWQKRVAGNWVDLVNENQEFLNFTAPLSETTTFRKRVSNTCGDANNSNEIVVNVTPVSITTFNYPATSFFPEDLIAVPQFDSGSSSNGFYVGTPGLVINRHTGIVDVISSTRGSHTVTYTSYGHCNSSSSRVITIEKDFLYENGLWTPNNPGDTTNPSTLKHTIRITENLIYNSSFIAKDIIISSGVDVVFNNQVDIYGTLLNEGRLNSNSILKAVNIPSNISWDSNATSLEVLELDNSSLELIGAYAVNTSVYNNDELSNSVLNVTNATVSFTSSASKTAIIDGANIDIIGDVNVAQYHESKRAFRFITSTVTSSTTIFENWQEDGDDDIMNLGTHITGNGGSVNGFDVSNSNASSMFEYDNLNQVWVAKASTNNTTTDLLSAGNPYRMFIRGDRQTSLTTNATGDETVLRTRGYLKNDSYTVPVIAQNAGEFSFVANPYQSNVNFKEQMDDLANGVSQDLNGMESNFYYVWDIRGNTSGVYRTYDRMTNSFVGAAINNSRLIPGIILPGQSFFVTASGESAGIIKINRTSNNSPIVNFNNNAPTSQPAIIKASLLESNSGTSLDGLMIRFGVNGNNDIDQNDAVKFGNIDENFGVYHANGDVLSIESRNLPVNGEEIDLTLTRYRAAQYTLELNIDNLIGVQAILVDNFLTTRTILDNGLTAYNFNVDNTQVGSIASDRFKIVFENVTLSVEDELVANQEFKIYPNPVSSNGDFTLDFGAIGNVNKVIIYNMLGQIVYMNDVEEIQKLSVNTADLSSGTYIVQIENQDQQFTQKLIVE